MKIGLKTVQEFLKLPEGKQFLAATILTIGVLCSVIAWQHVGEGMDRKAYDRKIERLNETVMRVAKECDSSKNAMRDRMENEKNAMVNETIGYLREGYAKKEQVLDEALAASKQTLIIQEKTAKKLKTIKKTLQNEPH